MCPLWQQTRAHAQQHTLSPTFMFSLMCAAAAGVEIQTLIVGVARHFGQLALCFVEIPLVALCSLLVSRSG
jgi:hypothetical protein